ncbi:flagellar basal body P-ring formation chaperone FlgA [Pseudooctadecabacter sp.]|uniref:flagellar basal body P-ring formation chaperone FlgA n=1 Tax=Pseudooctadecabacter sp. TaxID=1966338 RepID=UPI0025F22E70|nr:flagellar basal body P-ring formation chaperone FlgA [Pseudooctadecabacter sp.]
MIRLAILLCCLCSHAGAETLIAARTIPARTILGPEDILIRDVSVAGGMADPSLAIGQEARVALYAGRPIRSADLSAPAVVERNQIIQIIYRRGGIVISTEGRALDRAGPGDWIRVMNLSSRATITAQIHESGVAVVSQ